MVKSIYCPVRIQTFAFTHKVRLANFYLSSGLQCMSESDFNNLSETVTRSVTEIMLVMWVTCNHSQNLSLHCHAGKLA